jgi:hypothetical protein
MRALLEERDAPTKYPIRGSFFGCCASARWNETRRIAVMSQKSFGFIAASSY